MIGVNFSDEKILQVIMLQVNTKHAIPFRSRATFRCNPFIFPAPVIWVIILNNQELLPQMKSSHLSRNSLLSYVTWTPKMTATPFASAHLPTKKVVPKKKHCKWEQWFGKQCEWVRYKQPCQRRHASSINWFFYKRTKYGWSRKTDNLESSRCSDWTMAISGRRKRAFKNKNGFCRRGDEGITRIVIPTCGWKLCGN